MRWIVAAVMAGVLAPAAAVAADTALAQTKPACESHAAGRDKLDVACPLHAIGSAQRYRFKANFTGSHDDTRLSMTATLDGVPLACEPGSTTSREGEDGDVSLQCSFARGSARVLRVTLSWWHALYTNFEFDSE